MKFLVTLVLALLVPKSELRLDRDGVRVGDEVVRGSLFQVKAMGGAAILASGTSIEPLASTVEVALPADRILALDPGIRVAWAEEGYRFSTHGDRKIRFAASGATLAAMSPALVTPTEAGWKIGDQMLSGRELSVRPLAQDEESNLDKMKESSDKIRTGGVPKLNTRHVRVFWNNPLTGAEAVDWVSVRIIPRVTPSGEP